MKSKKQGQSARATQVSKAPPTSESSPSNADVQQGIPNHAANGLPPTLMSSMEELSGEDLSNVEVHRNSDKPAQIGAHAYAQGDDIHLGQGAEQTLPHEAWHVVQQRQGRVTPTSQVGDTGVNSSASLESEADSMGAMAASGTMTSESSASGASGSSGASSNVIQRVEHEDLNAAVALAQAVKAMFADGESTVPNKVAALASPLTGSSDKSISGLAKVINGGNKTIFTNRKSQIEGMAESLLKKKAKGLEAKDGGHSLDRHGPQVTDTQLQDRLKTGDAPDGAFSPAPGLSTRFSDHGAYLKSRVLAGDGLKKAFDASKNHLKVALNTLHKKKTKFDTALTTLQTCANNEKAAKAVLKDDANQAFKDQQTVVKDLVTGIGQYNSTMAPVKFKPQSVDPKDWIQLYTSYNSVVDNGGTIGTGFSGRDTSKTTHPEVIGGKREHDTWAQTDDAGDMTITRSGIEAPSNAERLFKKHKPADWKFYQHFPVIEPAGFSV